MQILALSQQRVPTLDTATFLNRRPPSVEELAILDLHRAHDVVSLSNSSETAQLRKSLRSFSDGLKAVNDFLGCHSEYCREKELGARPPLTMYMGIKSQQFERALSSLNKLSLETNGPAEILSRLSFAISRSKVAAEILKRHYSNPEMRDRVVEVAREALAGGSKAAIAICKDLSSPSMCAVLAE